jgi:hypothetical protein
MWKISWPHKSVGGRKNVGECAEEREVKGRMKDPKRWWLKKRGYSLASRRRSEVVGHG